MWEHFPFRLEHFREERHVHFYMYSWCIAELQAPNATVSQIIAKFDLNHFLADDKFPLPNKSDLFQHLSWHFPMVFMWPLLLTNIRASRNYIRKEVFHRIINSLESVFCFTGWMVLKRTHAQATLGPKYPICLPTTSLSRCVKLSMSSESSQP